MATKKKSNTPFMSLRKFLLLTDSTDSEPKRSTFHFLQFAQDFVKRYDDAKTSWNKYGADGPPVGSKVIILESGHGKMYAGCIHTFEGICPEDPRFFLISRLEKRFGGELEKYNSMVNRNTWFVSFKVIGDSRS